MKKLRLKNPWAEPCYPEYEEEVRDTHRLVRICNDRGYEVKFQEACEAWEQHSGDYCAGWLFLDPADDDVFKHLMEYLVCDEGEEERAK
jgi:hypothetical protein